MKVPATRRAADFAKEATTGLLGVGSMSQFHGSGRKSTRIRDNPAILPVVGTTA